MAVYCGPCGRRLFGDEGAGVPIYGDFTLDVADSPVGKARFGLCEGGHWFLWRRTRDGVVTATLPYRIGKTPTGDEVLAAVGGEEEMRRG